MAEIVVGTIELARNKLRSQPPDVSIDYMMRLIPNDFDKLLNSRITDQILLFCRQMKRLMDYNDPLPFKLLFEWHEDICCLIEELNDQQRHIESPERFRNKMNLEKALENRQLQFYKSFGSRKTFTELVREHEIFFRNYRQKCLSLHSKIEVQDLIGNFDDFISKVYQIESVKLTQEKREKLKQKLQHLQIDFDCSNRIFQLCKINSIQNTFLPSVEHSDITFINNSFERIQELLNSNRWLIILGEAGTGKSALLHWLTSQYSKEDSISIPIFIRIVDFAEWLMHNETKTLIDYISWLSQYVYDDHGEGLFKKSIDHSHALVLLDGLNEIPNFEQRKQIVDLVRQFIDEYIRAPDFTSPFDYQTVRKDIAELVFEQVIETPLPSHANGNQILITSRSTGYTLHPIVGSFIKHYALLSMEEEQAEEFARQWLYSVDESIIEIFNSENIEINEQRRIDLSQKRISNIESMFPTISRMLTANPLLLSSICSSIIQSSDPIYFDSRTELYDHIVQTIFSDQKIQRLSRIPKAVFNDFLIDLAIYLHLNSQSGLIDEFDIKKLCMCSLKQQKRNLFGTRAKLSECVDSLINLLDSSLGFIVQRGLQVYGFQHLSFQEYFVAQGLVRNSSIEQISERILSFTIHPRFHESIRLAIEWMSFSRSHEDYEQFCEYFINATEKYSMPFGIILLFDTFDDMKMKPSTKNIISALTKLFHSPCHLIVSTYFFWNLSKLSDEIIVTWMQSSLTNEQLILKFCQCLERLRARKANGHKSMPKLHTCIYRQLWAFHHDYPTIEFDIDLVLRTIMLKDTHTDKIFNEELALSLISNNQYLPHIHPFIFIVISAVCGGLFYRIEETLLKLYFSADVMHRESNIFGPIIEYLHTNEELNLNHIQLFIKYYEENLDQCLPTDSSSVTVDMFIALICLKGLSDISFYNKYIHYQALSLALKRFRWNWYYLMSYVTFIDIGTFQRCKTSFIESEIKNIIATFPSELIEQKNSFSLACIMGWNKMRQNMTNLLKTIHFRTNHCGLLVLLDYLPRYLHKLYSYSIQTNCSLPFVVFLTECLTQIDANNQTIARAVTMLKPIFDLCRLENYALAQFREMNYDISWYAEDSNRCHPFFVEENFRWQTVINIEHDRIIENQERKNDLLFFSAALSLARCLRGRENAKQYYREQSDDFLLQSERIFFAITNISDSILRIIAFSIILNMKNPMIVDIERKNQLRDEMIGLLFSQLADFPLLTSTYLFIHCYRERIYYFELFKEMSLIIGRKLNETIENQSIEEYQAAFIALYQLRDPYLTEFSRKLPNLSDILPLNSLILHNYLSNTWKFPSCSRILLSLIYLNELSFDVQHLEMLRKTHDNKQLSSMVRESLNELWKESPRFEPVLTYRIAIIITKHIQNLDQHTISSIIRDIFQCVEIEKRAIPVIQQWLEYKSEKHLYRFAQFAALELFIAGSSIVGLVDFVNQMIVDNDFYRLIFVVDRLFNSPFVSLQTIRQILVTLRKYEDISKIEIQITRKETLELILQFEFEQLTTKIYQPYLFMIKSCSIDLQRNLCTYFINVLHKINSKKKETCIVYYLEWIIDLLIENEIDENLVKQICEMILNFIHNQEYIRIRKAIVDDIFRLVYHINRKFIFLIKDQLVKTFEKIITNWQTYPKSILSISLLIYGNVLYQLSVRNYNFHLKKKIQRNLRNIYTRFFPRIISIRAGFCLIYARNWHRGSVSILSCFQKIRKQEIPSQTQFEILLQYVLYKKVNRSNDLNNIIDHFDTYPKSMNIFVRKFYKYLSNENDFDQVPDYLDIVKLMLEKHSKIFFDAIRKSSVGKTKFRAAIYKYYLSNPSNFVFLIHIYSSFGVVTSELLHMLDSSDTNFSLTDFSKSNFKHISDGAAVEKLFSLLDSKRNHQTFGHFLYIVKCLINANVISSLELHKQLRFHKSVLYESDTMRLENEEDIFDLLLATSCFKDEKISPNVRKSFTTEDCVNKSFDEEMKRSDKQFYLSYE